MGEMNGERMSARNCVCLCNVDQPVIPSEGDPYFHMVTSAPEKLSGQAADKMQAA